MNKISIVLCLSCIINCGNGIERTYQTPVIGKKGSKCYDNFNRPQRCIPEFENAAFNMLMEATNTCGDHGVVEYCVQTGVSGIKKSCETCYPHQHHARYLTDIHQQDNPTWWQSETMLEGIQWPYQVNLTLKFGKAFDITYIRLLFWSPRPESFYLSKKTTEDGPWIPYQYYSATCRDTYGLPDTIHTTRGDETRALCTSEYSDISPLSGGNVAFGTLEGRPSAYNFDDSPELQEWVTATEIMITLDRINTFGDEVFGDQKVLRSYLYAIADIAVGARCKCNGHASECVTHTGLKDIKRRVCKCEHNTAGPDCNECLPFYNDVPWGRANARDAHECKQCNCNGYSNHCYFDQRLYEQTGHGGHCLDCSANRDGPNCERCKENYHLRRDGYCIPCNCNEIGSLTFQCNPEGKCQCKPGVTGEKCDRCKENYFNFSAQGCKNCGCFEQGSLNNRPSCDPHSGTCYCKENVEGKWCRECKPGFFNLDHRNKFGCTPCFCYGHSSQCSSDLGFSKYLLESTFVKNSEKWIAKDEYGKHIELKYNSLSQSIGVGPVSKETVYFIAPNRFLGDQRASYNQLIEFTLGIESPWSIPLAANIILEGGGNSIINTMLPQQNKTATMQNQRFSFRLHEHPDYGWQPRLSFRAFYLILTNLTAAKIQVIYPAQSVGYLVDVKLESAARGLSGAPALWIESCNCPSGYLGQYCELCAPGYRHSPTHGGPLVSCIPCDCNSHAGICDSETGRCICQHNTRGDNCELCARGYYGYALGGTPEDCLPCNCPNGGACIQVDEDIIMCTECPLGYTGHRCNLCSDGYYGDPSGKFGLPTSCKPCECNMNVDLNAIGNCDTVTGECLKCIYNTAGPRCDICLPGYYGDALALPKGDCKQCQCFPLGTEDFSGVNTCDRVTGACRCKPHVVGANCDKCKNGYYNLQSNEGCQTCNCDRIGSVNQTCDAYTGQCYCRPAVTGLRCDHCEARTYGFSSEGCKKCDCDATGSKSLQCDISGQCLCLDNIEGRKCNMCKENKYDKERGCIDCPKCYNLVQNATRFHNDMLDKLNKILYDIEQQPLVIANEDFAGKLKELQENVDELHEKVKTITDGNGLMQQLPIIRGRTEKVSRALFDIEEHIFVINDKIFRAEQDIFHTNQILEEASERINEIRNNINSQGRNTLEDAYERSQIIGQQSDKMVEIAHEARDLSNLLYAKANKIIDKVKEAKVKSVAAYDKVKKANLEQTQISEAIWIIKQSVLSTQVTINKLKEFLKEVSYTAETAKNNALTLLNEVKNIIIPQIDIPKLKESSKDLQQEASRLKNEITNIFRNTDELRKNVYQQNHFGKQLLRKAQNRQEDINNLRNDLIFYKSQADGAINLWHEIWTGAETNYKLLAEFDSQTQKSKKEAEAALQTIEEVEAAIKDTTDKTTSVQTNLENAKKNANFALENALQANVLAKNASIKAERIKSETEVLYKNTTALSEETELMFDRVQNTEEEFKNLLGKTKSNSTLVGLAKETVGRATKDTNGTSKKISGLLEDIEKIMIELQHSPDINDNEINRLEQEIHLTEERLIAAKLDEKLETLKNEYKMQGELIEEYRNQVLILQNEVKNTVEIINTLPEGCFRRVELEP